VFVLLVALAGDIAVWECQDEMCGTGPGCGSGWGDYRIIYDVDDTTRTVTVAVVVHAARCTAAWTCSLRSLISPTRRPR
jgi:hypothetical protein